MLHTSSFLVAEEKIMQTALYTHLIFKLRTSGSQGLTEAFPLLEGHHLHGFFEGSHFCVLLRVGLQKPVVMAPVYSGVAVLPRADK